MKKLITLLALLATTSVLAQKIVCTNPNQYGYGNQQNSLTIEIVKGQEGQYLNGRIELRGYELHNYFSPELNSTSLKKETAWYGGGGRSFYVYRIKARVDLGQKRGIKTGRHEVGLEVFPDYGGVKLISLNNGHFGGKDWWFKDCHYSKY